MIRQLLVLDAETEEVLPLAVEAGEGPADVSAEASPLTARPPDASR